MCEICGREYKDIHSHLKRHKDTKVYKCSECSFQTKYAHTLRKHLIRHKKIADGIPTKTRLLKCDSCAFQTLNWQEWNRHLKSHTPLSSRDLLHYKCPYCDYANKKKEVLAFHLRKHQPKNIEGKRKCDQCDYWTRFENHLRRHKAYHKIKNIHNSLEEVPRGKETVWPIWSFQLTSITKDLRYQTDINILLLFRSNWLENSMTTLLKGNSQKSV